MVSKVGIKGNEGVKENLLTIGKEADLVAVLICCHESFSRSVEHSLAFQGKK